MNKIQNKIFIFVSILFLFFSLGMILFTFQLFKKESFRDTGKNLRLMTDQVRVTLDEKINSGKTIIELITQFPILNQYLFLPENNRIALMQSAVLDQFMVISKAHKELLEISLWNRDGKLDSKFSPFGSIDTNKEGRTNILVPDNKKDQINSKLLFHKKLKRPVLLLTKKLMMASKLRGGSFQKETFQGYLSILMEVDFIKKFHNSFNSTEQVSFFINEKGENLFFPLKEKGQYLINSVQFFPGKLKTVDLGKEKKLIYCQEIHPNIHIVVSALIGTLDKDFSQYYFHILLTFLGMLFGFGISIYFYFKKVLVVPLKEIVDACNNIGEGNFDVKISVDQKSELGLLANSIIKMSENIQSTQNQLAQTSKLASLGELSSGMAHEINNPLFLIKGFNNRIKATFKKNENGPLPFEKIKNYVGEIDDSCHRLSAIVARIKEFSRIPEDTYFMGDLNEIVKKALSLFGNQLALDNIHVKEDLSNDVTTIWCNRNKLEQVFFNLIGNAKDALLGQDLGRTKRINVKTVVENDQVTVFFQDNGPGIEEQDQEKVFNPFFTTKPSGKGTGLGLSISHSIISEHKGKLRVHSIPGEETIFIITFPKYKENKETDGTVVVAGKD